MEIKARLTGVTKGLDGGYNLTFSTSEEIRHTLEGMQNKDLRLKAVEWREKRSLSANAYYYVLLGKIAEKARITLTAAHNKTISDYGMPEPGAALMLLESVDYLEIPWAHLHPTTETRMIGGVMYRTYLVMRGSHTYDSAEMAALIAGTVEDAKALGVETLTPKELEDMLRTYEINHRKV